MSLIGERTEEIRPPSALSLKLAVDDIKAFYTEAASGPEPGKSNPRSRAIADWFWNETMAARVLREVKETCQNASDPMLRVAGKALIVPMDRFRF